jgi:N6-L-threonylcarbamoyladenine synthase
MHGHVLAHFIDDENREKPEFPFICLTVSGGHTQIVVVNDYLDMEVVGTTKDDAAGEAFDKTAKLLGIPYPGGPLIDKYAKEGDPKKFTFSKPQVPGLDFSFSGLKTNVLQFLQRETNKNSNFVKENLNDICASLQETIIDILFDNLIKATKQFNIDEVAIAGGVSANSALRARLQSEGIKRNWKIHIPKFEYCTDNAAMIAIAGRYQFLVGNYSNQTVSPNARLKM